MVRSKAINQPITPYKAIAAGALHTLIKKYFSANSSTSLEAGDTQNPSSINGFRNKNITKPAQNPKNIALKRYARTSFSSRAPNA